MVPLRGKKGPNSSLHCCHSETALAVEESAAACSPMVPATSRFLPSVEMTNAPEATTASENCCTAGCDLWPGQMPEQSRHCCHSETALAVEESAVACSAMVSATSRFLPSVGMTKCRDGTPRRRKTAAQPIVTSARANARTISTLLSFRNGVSRRGICCRLQRHGAGHKQIPPSGRNDKRTGGQDGERKLLRNRS